MDHHLTAASHGAAPNIADDVFRLLESTVSIADMWRMAHLKHLPFRDTWIREFSTVRFWVGRGAGHTTSVLLLASKMESEGKVVVVLSKFWRDHEKNCGELRRKYRISHVYHLNDLHKLRGLGGFDVVIVDGSPSEAGMEEVYSIAGKDLPPLFVLLP